MLNLLNCIYSETISIVNEVKHYHNECLSKIYEIYEN